MKRYLNVDVPKAIKEFEVALRKMVTTRIVGHYSSIFRGRGLEFDSYRIYIPSRDDAQTIDWKASMRSNDLLVKEYIEERDLQIYFLIDVSSTMVFGSAPKLKNEYALELAAALANLILKAGDRVGFVLFNESIAKVIVPGQGPRQLFLMVKSLSDPDLYGGGYNLSKVIKFLIGTLKSDVAAVVIISDFIGPRNWGIDIKTLNKKIETIGIMISDPRDRVLPADSGQIVLADPFSNKTELVDPALIKEKYERYARQQEEEIQHFFEEAGCDFLKISTDKSFVIPLAGFFKMRAKKWR